MTPIKSSTPDKEKLKALMSSWGKKNINTSDVDTKDWSPDRLRNLIRLKKQHLLKAHDMSGQQKANLIEAIMQRILGE